MTDASHVGMPIPRAEAMRTMASMTAGQGVAVVTGASGFVGHYLLDALRRSGQFSRIMGVTRQQGLAMSEGISPIYADLIGEGLPPLPADVLFHVAGEKRAESDMHASNVVGTRRLLDWAVKAGIRKVVYVSSVGVYGAPPDSGSITETSPRSPANLYETTKNEAEIELAAFCRERLLDFVIVQPSNVIGVGLRGERPLLGFLRGIAGGRVPTFGREAKLNYVAVEDVAGAMCHAALASVSGDTFILNRAATLGAVMAAVRGALNIAGTGPRLPYPVGRALALLCDGAARMGLPSVPFDSARLRELTNTTVYDGSRIERQLSFRYQFGAEEAVSRLALAYRGIGLL